MLASINQELVSSPIGLTTWFCDRAMNLSDSVIEEGSRVVVVGKTCCGRTTFAGRLEKAWGVPRVELDALYWLADWTPRDESEFQSLVRDALVGRTGFLTVITADYKILSELSPR